MMSAMKRIRCIVLVMLAAVPASITKASDRLPEGAKPMREVVAALEKSGYQIVEASMDDRRWEVDAYRENVSYELYVDPKTGEVLSEHRDAADPAPAADALPLSSILDAVKQAGFHPIVELEFEHGRWEIDAYRDRGQRELRVDPSNGKILEDRADN